MFSTARITHATRSGLRTHKKGAWTVATAAIVSSALLVQITNASATTPAFATAVNYGLNGGVKTAQVAVGDFNHDGIPDLVTVNASTNNVSVFFGHGDGTFATATNYALGDGNTPIGVAVGDLRGDGKLDIVTANALSDDVSVLLGNGDGTFGTASNVGLNGGHFPFKVHLADMNHNGHLDIVTANGNSDDVSVLLGNGDGTFGTATNLPLGGGVRGPEDLAIEDFNGDGHLDIVTANARTNDLSLLLANGSGGYATATTIPIASGAARTAAVTAADLRGNGKLDLVVTSGTGGLSVLLGNGDGTFGTASAVASGGTKPMWTAVGDIDGDDHLDLVVADSASGDVSVLLGNGDGTFGAPTVFGLGGATTPQTLALGQLDDNNSLDIVTANFSNNVSVLLNTLSGRGCDDHGDHSGDHGRHNADDNYGHQHGDQKCGERRDGH
jgi:VCBS repeat protein